MMTDDTDKPKKPGFGARLRASVSAATTKAVEFAKGIVSFDAFASFTADGKEVSLPIDFEADTIWATYAQMAELFGTEPPAITKHVQNVCDSGELEREATSSKMEVVRQEGTRTVRREIEHFNLDMILAVGYRVNSRKATEFRKWATTVLKGYIEKGYALNGKRLDNDPAALLALAREVRAIRTSEKNLYEQVRETFAQCAIDYDKDDPAARTFFQTSQDTFHYAASGQTALQIIQSRADASKPNMGLTALGNQKPLARDVTVAKNYCSTEEIRKMQLIGEAWLLYAEGMAMQGKQVSMQRLLVKLRELVAQYEFPVFPGYQQSGLRRDIVHKYAKQQLSLFNNAGRSNLPPSPSV